MISQGKKAGKIVFINSLPEAEDYLRTHQSKHSAGDVLFIGMNPGIRALLKRKGLEVVDTSDYFTTASHIEALKKSDALVKWLEANAGFIDPGMGVSLAYRDFFIYWIRFTIHCCIWTIEVASNAIDMHGAEKVCAYLPDKKFVASLYIEPAEGYFGCIIRDVARSKKITFENLSGGINRAGLSQRRTANYALSLIRFILQSVKFRIWEIFVRVKNLFSKRRPVLFTTKFYNLDKLAQKFGKAHSGRRSEILRGPVIFTFGLSNTVIRLFAGRYSKKIISQKKMFGELEERIAEEKGLFAHRGVSFADIISGKIRDNLGDHIMGLMLWTVKLSHFVDSSDATAFVSNGIRADDVILAELCAKKGVPAVLVSHGSHVRPKNESEMIEWGEHGRALLRAPFSYIALQTPVAEGYLDVFKTNGKVLKTGPLIWGKPVERRKSEVRVVMHAGTAKPANSLRPFVYETPDEYIRDIKELAGAVEKIPATVLLVRFRPSQEMSAKDLSAFVPFSDKVILNTEGTFADVLGTADLLVSFSSTTIEEALQNRIPVLLYGGGGRYQHTPGYELKPGQPVLRSAVYHVTEAKDLEYAISRILELKIEGESKDRNLFDGYIYNEGVREHLESILKS